jgi:hypothetical protein
MFSLLFLWIGALVRLFRGNLVLKNLVLRQQLAVLKRRHPRSSLGLFDKLFGVVARRLWSEWRQTLIVVTPESVVRWHQTGFRMYWPKEVRELIRRMVVENQTWGAPRIQGELLMLSFDLPRNHLPLDETGAKRS